MLDQIYLPEMKLSEILRISVWKECRMTNELKISIYSSVVNVESANFLALYSFAFRRFKQYHVISNMKC